MKLFNIGGNKDEPLRGKGKEQPGKKEEKKDEEKEDNFTGIASITQDDTPENTGSDTYDNTSREAEEEIATEDDDSDYINPEDLNYIDYEDIVDTIENNGWVRISTSGLRPITHHDYQMIFSKSVKKDLRETVLEVKCPEGKIITVCGFNHDDIDRERFLGSPNLYSRPHFVALRCADYNNNEISSATIVSIAKTNKNDEIEQLYQEFYGDLSPINDGKLKKKGERYYFAETVILQKGEKLIFQVLGPDKDISKIDFLMMSDMFIKDE